MYCGYITRITNLRKHPNADRLLLGDCYGNQVIVSTDIPEGKLGIYFPVDGQLGLEYATANNLLRSNDHTVKGGYLDPKKRNIRAINLRGEKSIGLFMPIESLFEFTTITELEEGQQITSLGDITICQKFVVRFEPDSKKRARRGKPDKAAKIHYVDFKEHIDTENIAYHVQDIHPGDVIYITEKLHGTSQRTMYAGYYIYIFSWLTTLLRYIGIHLPFKKSGYRYVSGTRRRTITDNYEGYYGSEQFRHEAASLFYGKLYEGEEVFYEIVGFTDEGRPLMGSYDTSEVGYKEFIRRYGNKVVFAYDCIALDSAHYFHVYVYRMTLTINGEVTEYDTEKVIKRCAEIGVDFVPVLHKFVFQEGDNIIDIAKEYSGDSEDHVGKCSTLDESHPREGIVIRVDNAPYFKAYKYKNWFFNALEGWYKDSGKADIEESQDA